MVKDAKKQCESLLFISINTYINPSGSAKQFFFSDSIHWLQHAGSGCQLLLYTGMVLGLKLCSDKSTINAALFITQCCLDQR